MAERAVLPGQDIPLLFARKLRLWLNCPLISYNFLTAHPHTRLDISLLRHGELLTIDKAEVKRLVAARLDWLTERVPGRRIARYPA